MKKSLVLAMALSLGIAGTAFAANPFSDVPSNHWAYASVSKLAQAGIVEGYGDDTFKGGKSITRYEMAQMVAKAMAKSDKADASQKAMIEKLAAEFSAELDNLGVRVTKLEKSADNVKITGEMRFRYRSFDGTQYVDSTQGKQDQTQLRTRLNLKGEINDKWTANMMLENTQDLTTNGRGDKESNTDFRRAWVSGSIDDVKVQAGRFAYSDVNSFLFDAAETDGVRLDFGNKLKATVLYGRMTPASTGAYKNDTPDVTTAALALDYKQDKWHFNTAYYDVDGKNAQALGQADQTSFGQFYAAYKFDKNFKLGAQLLMAGDDVNQTDKTGYTARLDYKGMNVADKGSWGAWVMGFDAPAGVLYAPAGMDWDLKSVYGAQGYEIGMNYAVQKNIKLQLSYSDLKETDDTGFEKADQKTTTAYMTFYF